MASTSPSASSSPRRTSPRAAPFTPTRNGNGIGYTSFTFQVQDNGGTANSGIDLDASANTFTFNVTAVNDAPVNTVPAAQSTTANTAKVFSTGNGNPSRSATSTPRPASSGPAGQHQRRDHPVDPDRAVVLGRRRHRGRHDDVHRHDRHVNTALNGLSFNPTPAFTGAATLQIVTSDLGATGTGGTLTDNDTVTINVSGRPVATATVANLAFTENGSAVALDS